MILTVDVGNSNIKFALFSQEKSPSPQPLLRAKIPTKQPHSAHGLYEWLNGQMDLSLISKAVFSSVVPSVNKALKEMFTLMDVPFKELTAHSQDVITSLGHKPTRLGADILSNAVASHYLFPQADKVIVSFGTALTFCALKDDGDVKGCAFMSGFGNSFRSLIDDAALLSDIELMAPQSILGQTTQEALQAGFIYGFQAMVLDISQKMFAEFSDKKEQLIVLTGYESRLVFPKREKNMLFEPHLTLQGLYFSS